ncbi:MAG: hypothetical protein KGL62_12190, partial [Bradyrhizobium sp.]|nr:hypothetical protein [Bradyrhizobium sp.]
PRGLSSIDLTEHNIERADDDLQSVAVPGMVARSLYGTGRVYLAQGAVITIQGAGAAFSPAPGGWIARWTGFASSFLVLGAFGLAAAAVWVVLGAAVKQY